MKRLALVLFVVLTVASWSANVLIIPECYSTLKEKLNVNVLFGKVFGDVTISTSSPEHVDYSIKLSDSSAETTDKLMFKLVNNTDDFYWSSYVMFSNVDNNHDLLDVRNSSIGRARARARYYALRTSYSPAKFTWVRGISGTTYTEYANSPELSAETWYHIELSVINSTATAYVNGVNIGSFQFLDDSNNPARIRYFNNYAASAGDTYLADIKIGLTSETATSLNFVPDNYASVEDVDTSKWGEIRNQLGAYKAVQYLLRSADVNYDGKFDGNDVLSIGRNNVGPDTEAYVGAANYNRAINTKAECRLALVFDLSGTHGKCRGYDKVALKFDEDQPYTKTVPLYQHVTEENVTKSLTSIRTSPVHFSKSNTVATSVPQNAVVSKAYLRLAFKMMTDFPEDRTTSIEIWGCKPPIDSQGNYTMANAWGEDYLDTLITVVPLYNKEYRWSLHTYMENNFPHSRSNPSHMNNFKWSRANPGLYIYDVADRSQDININNEEAYDPLLSYINSCISEGRTHLWFVIKPHEFNDKWKGSNVSLRALSRGIAGGYVLFLEY